MGAPQQGMLKLATRKLIINNQPQAYTFWGHPVLGVRLSGCGITCISRPSGRCCFVCCACHQRQNRGGNYIRLYSGEQWLLEQNVICSRD